jgi:hypothetical protein
MRLATLAIIAALTIALTGCGNLTTEDGTQSNNSETAYKLKDGRTVVCIYGRYRLSCDWEHAK